MSEIEEMKDFLISDIEQTLEMAPPNEPSYYIVCRCMMACPCVIELIDMPYLLLHNCYSQEMVDWVTSDQPLRDQNITVKANCVNCNQITLCGEAGRARSWLAALSELVKSLT